ncbi:hypothetical protein GCM10010124_31540 [Pilimelia terevasa]|uniref:Protein involved in plasmid replication-relaxation n=1 Tax=Pilimelia terevasa TaxID=53372 RepID=A0A8J3BQP5_9ACTN|nr:replication-relaxation family protein [Pilimelia terevasa]GGK36567.1 hypothetical protein GCM10010124_31540 [Pilimelia terevasa]
MPAVDPLIHLRHVTVRDRLLMSWLTEHYILSTEQITQALFPSLRSAQVRLRLLTRIGAVTRFVLPMADTTSSSYRYTLGPLGALLHPTAWQDPDNPAAKPARTHLERRNRIVRSPRLGHLLGVNTFFTALYGHARTCPDAALQRWWSEQHATSVYSPRSPKLRPDAYGVWTHHGQLTEFFLEYDTGTEGLPRVLAKLGAYEDLAHETGVARTLLLYVPDTRRRGRLTAALHGEPLLTPVAVAAHTAAPHEAVWHLPGHTKPLALHELPSTHPDD